jgi:serine/threonine-protein kinase
MNCVKCGKPLEEGSRFCGGCGTQQPNAVIPQAAVRTGAKTVFGSPAPVMRPPPAAPPAPAPAPAAPKPAGVAYAETVAPAPRPASAPAAPPRAAPPPAAQPRPATVPMAELEPVPVDGDLTGRTLNNRYVVEEKIGEGGFGAVYRARQTQMNRLVALKVLHARMAKDPQVVGRFKREAQASSQLRAPHTVQVYDFDQTPEGIMYLAMEMLQGRSLHSILKEEQRVDAIRMAKIMDGIADSLGEAHAQGIVHRDIKPENIFLEPRPTPDFVKVLDFGIAKIISGDGMSASGPALTAAGQTLGTLEYMSPEQLMGAQLDGRSDLYALGIMAYEMLTGRLPFDAKTPGEMITAHLKTMPPPPSTLVPGIPPAMDQIVLRLLAKARDQRFGGTDDLRRELAVMIQSESGPVAIGYDRPPSGGAAPAVQPGRAAAAPAPQRNTPVDAGAAPAGGASMGKPIALAGLILGVFFGLVILLRILGKH